jgi:hypothetical protein
MSKPEKPFRVKLFAGILTGRLDLLEPAALALTEAFGPIDYRSRPVPFDVTNYYEAEMGPNIERVFFSFENLILPDRLPSVKVKTDAIEEKFAEQGKRPVNIDPGYMDYHKVVLASNKYGSQKVYLSEGVWADITLHYTKGRFLPHDWSFPDFKKGLYDPIFIEIRARYKKGLASKDTDSTSS